MVYTQRLSRTEKAEDTQANGSQTAAGGGRNLDTVTDSQQEAAGGKLTRARGAARGSNRARAYRRTEGRIRAKKKGIRFCGTLLGTTVLCFAFSLKWKVFNKVINNPKKTLVINSSNTAEKLKHN